MKVNSRRTEYLWNETKSIAMADNYQNTVRRVKFVAMVRINLFVNFNYGQRIFNISAHKLISCFNLSGQQNFFTTKSASVKL